MPILLFNYFYQLAAKTNQALMLALFVGVFPYLTIDSSSWLAQYFLSLSLISPIFMFFSFELRKITAASIEKDITSLNKKRVFGLLLGFIFSVFLLIIFFWLGYIKNYFLFLALLFFTIINMLNDQISANYEWAGNHKDMMKSVSLKVFFFVVISSSISILFSVELGIFFGVIGIISGIFLFDYQHNMIGEKWFFLGDIRLLNTDWIAGTASFLASLTIHLPRIIAGVLFGEIGLVIIGVGQSLNKVGQLLSSAFTQLILSSKDVLICKNLLLGGGIQFFVFILFVLCMPLWESIFSYIDNKIFNYYLAGLLFFGFVSQVNYLLQSIVLVKYGAIYFLQSVFVFLLMFLFLSFFGWMFDIYSLLLFIATLIVSRSIQLYLNIKRNWGYLKK